jgi:hypothetical protein
MSVESQPRVLPPLSAAEAARNLALWTAADVGKGVAEIEATLTEDGAGSALDLAAELLELSAPARLVLGQVVSLALDAGCAERAHRAARRWRREHGNHPAVIDAVLALAGHGVGLAWAMLAPTAELRRKGAVVLQGELASPAPALLRMLLGGGVPSSLLPFAVAGNDAPGLAEALAKLRPGWLQAIERVLAAGRPLILSGTPGFGASAWIEAVVRPRQLQVRTVDLSAVFDVGQGLPTELLASLNAEARLTPVVWVLAGLERLETAVREKPLGFSRLIEGLVAIGRPMVLAHEGPLAPDMAQRLAALAGLPHLDLPALTAPERQELWRTLLEAGGIESQLAGKTVQSLAHLALGPVSIVHAVAHALQQAQGRAGRALANGAPLEQVIPTALELRVACTTASTSRLRQYGSRVDTRAGWADLVLPKDCLLQVQELARFARVRDRLFDDYGFGDKLSYGRALSAMLSGPSGTGKTMVAGLIAQELGVELYRVDLSRVVSKYIGETEERLGSLFSEAAQVGAALLFDEADSLFGQRTEIKSSNDRYANLEVNYLLQRLEEFDGVVILTTNFAGSIDEAFLRRLRFRVQFPFPSPKERAKLWEVMLPGRLPIDDEGLDFDWMGSSFELTGGHIRNAMLRAGMIAADANKPLTMRMFYDAAATEYKELGKLAPAYPFDDD